MIRKKLFIWLLLYYEGTITKTALAKNLGLKAYKLNSYLKKLEKIITANYKKSEKEKK